MIQLNTFRCYKYLRTELKYPLPCISSLQKWIRKLNIHSGLLLDSIEMLAIHAKKLTERDKLTVLVFDEMKVLKMYEYDHKVEEVVEPHDQMQVIMARGLFSKWKMPVYIDFDDKMTVLTLESVTKCLKNIGYTVVAMASDNGGSNVGLRTNLNVEHNLPHFYMNGDKIHMLSDAPHILKLIRNWLLDHNFILSDGRKVSKSVLINLVNLKKN